MLDLNQLISKQNEGNQFLATLVENEAVILQNYSYMAARELTREAHSRGEPINNLILNAFRNGICLGLGLQVESGTVQERR